MRDFSVAKLEKLLETKRSVLNALLKRREQLIKALATVDLQITRIGGTGSEAMRKVRPVKKRLQNDKTLQEVVFELLGKSKQGFKLGDLADKVLATGYKSGSAKFANTVYQFLYNNQDRIVCDPKTRCYKLK